MNNAMQLKAIIKNIAKEKSISAQLVMQNFMLERLLERVSVSKYQDSFILKGGFLIAAMVGLDTRATMDMDATIKGMPVTEDTVKVMFTEICDIALQDDVTFTFISIGDIREEDEYSGFRVSLSANYPPMAVPLKLDITTGDKITPKEISYEFKLLLEDRSIRVLAYNLETVLAEKLETILSRSTASTRMRDYYDVYTLTTLRVQVIDWDIFVEAFKKTADKRGSYNLLQEKGKENINEIENSLALTKLWERYQQKNDYASDLTWTEAVKSVKDLYNKVF
jgi:predicted nucleotidyltransferase component of viral defense system